MSQGISNPGLRRSLTGLVVVACAITGVALASDSGDTTQHRLAAGSATQPNAVSAEQKTSFGILRSAARAVPPEVSQAFANSPQYKQGFAPNAALAQPLPHTNPYTSSEPWVVPSDNGLCLYVPDTEGWASTCNTLDEAKAGQLHLVLAPFGKPSFLVGVVPDGVTHVTVSNADGSTSSLPVTGNSYALQSSEARSLQVESLDVAVPQAPKTPPVGG